MTEVAIGIDIGGTNMRIGAVGRDGETIIKTKTKTQAETGVLSMTENLKKNIALMLSTCNDKGLKPIGIGIGIPGIISPGKGIVHFSPNLPGWKNVPLKAMIKTATGLNVHVENDANAYALGEARYGAGQGATSLVCITLGTGVGGGIILGGKIWRGADGTAGEVGHITVRPDGLPCPCGSRGCIERYASATAVVERTRLALEKGETSVLSLSGPIDPEKVADAARKGDALARRIFSEAGENLGIVIADLINLLNIEKVVIGGGLSASWELFIAPLKAEVAARSFKIPAARCEILPGILGDLAGVLGSAGLVFKKS